MAMDGGLERSARSSRGKRMSKLLEDEVEADEEFWNQEAFQEEAEDLEYEEEAEEADVFDSDFDEDEPEEDGEDEDEDERRPKKKKKILLGKPDKKKGDSKFKLGTKKSVSSLVEITASVAAGEELLRPAAKPPRPPKIPSVGHLENREGHVDAETTPGIRKSTRMAVVVRQAEREAQQAALQALAKPVVKKKKEEDRKITQEEMLLEAAETEIQNLQTLEIMLAREEEVKRKAVVHKTTYNGPMIRFYSRDGTNTLRFIKLDEYPEIFTEDPKPYPKKAFCVITGLPAKYRDPKTGQPYATKEAFKLIRDRFSNGENTRKKLEESHQRKRTKVERERPGPGSRNNVAKLKFKKVITTTDSAALPPRAGIVPGQPLNTVEVEVLTPVQRSPPDPPSVLDSLRLSPVSTLDNKNEDSRSILDEASLGRDLPPLQLPDPLSETNEADFLLDDLEVSLPSNLDSGLTAPILLSNADTGPEVRDTSLESEDLVIRSGDDQGLDMLSFSDLGSLDPAVKTMLQ